MNLSAKKTNHYMHFWIIPESLFLGLLLLIIFISPFSTPLMLPIIAIGGVASCHVWKWRGMGIASAILLVSMFYFLYAQPYEMWLWTVTISLSIASTFVVTTLCSEEAYGALHVLRRDLLDQRKTISQFNEHLSSVQNKAHTEAHELNTLIAKNQQLHEEKQARFIAEKKDLESLIVRLEDQLRIHEENERKAAGEQRKLKSQIAELQEQSRLHEEERVQKQDSHTQIAKLQEQIRVYEEKQRSHEQLLKLAKNEVLSAYSRQEKLMQELQIAKQSPAEEWRLRYEERNREFVELQVALAEIKQEKETVKHLYDESQQKTRASIKQYQDLEKEYASLIQLHEETKQQLYEELETKQEKLTHEEPSPSSKSEESASSEQGSAEQIDIREYRRMEGLYNQLRSQFEEKTAVLNHTRRELFEAQEKWLALQKDFQEATLHDEKGTRQELHALLEKAEQERLLLEEQQETEIRHLHELVEALSLKLQDGIACRN